MISLNRILLFGSLLGNVGLLLLWLLSPEKARVGNRGPMKTIPQWVKPRPNGSITPSAESVSRTLPRATATRPTGVELPWNLVRPLLAVLPFYSDGTPSKELIGYLGLSPQQAKEIEKLSRHAISSQAQRVLNASELDVAIDGTFTNSIPPVKDEVAETLIPQLEKLNLTQFETIKEMIFDAYQPETEHNSRTLTIQRNGKDGYVVVEKSFIGDMPRGSQTIHFKNLNSMSLEYAMIIKKFVN